MYSIQLDHITHNYNDKKVINDFSFMFNSGQTYCLLGPSGCGKTTILRLIAGLEVPQDGSIVINGKVVTDKNKILVLPHKREVGFVFQDLALWPHFSVYENIAFGLREKSRVGIHKPGKVTIAQIEEKVLQLLDFFGISEHQKKYPHQLSGGQKQMVAIARSLALNPKILMLDEPMANIDAQLKETIIEHLYTLQKQLTFTMIYVTHDHREAMYGNNNIIIMNRGEIVNAGTKEQVLNTKEDFTQSFIKL